MLEKRNPELNSTQRAHRTLLSDFTQVSLSSMLEEIDIGRIRLPYFHRDWCWQDDQILNFLESIGQGDPIGSLTFVRATPLGHRAFAGVNRTIMDGAPVHLVLDGQQRMTAAYQACYKKMPVNLITRARPEHRLYYFNMEGAISSLARMKDAIFSIVTSADGRPFRKGGIDYTDPLFQFRQGIFPTNAVFNCETYILQYTEYWNRTNNAARRQEAMQILRDFRMTVLTSFECYKIPVHKLERPRNDDALCRIYEKLNLGS